MQEFVNTIQSFNSYINDRRIVQLKTLDGTVITTDMANTMYNYFSSVFNIEQLNNVPQLGQHEVNILDTFNFSTKEVQEKLQQLNIYKSKGQDLACFTLGF